MFANRSVYTSIDTYVLFRYMYKMYTYVYTRALKRYSVWILIIFMSQRRGDTLYPTPVLPILSDDVPRVDL